VGFRLTSIVIAVRHHLEPTPTVGAVANSQEVSRLYGMRLRVGTVPHDSIQAR
jgi:hypothetical protein